MRLLVSAVLLLTSVTPAGAAFVVRVKTDGFADATFPTAKGAVPPCPDTEAPPPAGTVCHEVTSSIFRDNVAVGGGPVAPPLSHWVVNINDYTLTFTDNDGNATVSDFVGGALDDPDVTFDREHLQSASVDADVPLSDGSTVTIHFDWSAISPRFVFGNNGPAGGARHVMTACSNTIDQAHQKFVFASMDGTYNGVSVHSYTAFPAAFISFNHFVLIDGAHGDCL